MNTNYSGNSIKSREGKKEDNKKEVTKVVKGVVKTKKKGEMSKIAQSIVSEEVRGIKDYAIYDVVIPVVKDTIAQLVKGSIDMLFYGEVRSSSYKSSGRSGNNASRVSYKDFYDDRGRRDRHDDRRAHNRQSYDDIEFESREDAEEVLNRMDEIVDQYGVVTVADLFDLAGKTGNGYTDQNYGWTSTRSASVERNKYGDFFIKLHRPNNIR